MVTPGNFERFVDYEAIARHFNLNIRDGVVRSTICPRCNAALMNIYRDFETAGWRWHCAKCKAAWTSIQLYQELKNIPVVRTAIYSLINDIGLSIGVNNLESQISEYVVYRERLDDLGHVIRRAHQRVCNDAPLNTIDILERLDLWSNQTKLELQATLGRFGGSLSWAGARQLSGLLYSKLTKNDFMWADCLMLPYEIAPGQLASLLLLDNTPAFKHLNCIPALSEGGILGLSAVSTIDEDVIGLVDPILFLYIRSRWFNTHHTDDDCGFFAYCGRSRSYYATTTALAFQSLKAKRIIFWDYNINIDGINAARQLKDRGFIAMRPNLPEFDKVKKAFVATQFDGVVKQIKDSAVPWVLALKQLLLTPDHTQRQLLITQLDPMLTYDEMEMLRKACTDGEWVKISACFYRVDIARTVQYGSLVFSYRPGKGIFQLSTDVRNPNEIQVLDVCVEFTEILQTDTDRVLSGNISIVDKVIEFKDTEQTIRKNFSNWITDQCLRIGLVPSIDEKRAKDLFAIVMNLSRPRIINAITKIGWYPVQKLWRFVQFEVGVNSFTPTPKDGSMFKVPSAHLLPSGQFPPHTTVSNWANNVESFNFYLNLLTYIFLNLLRAKFGLPKQGIALGAKEFSGITHLGTVLGLQAYAQRKAMNIDRMQEYQTLELKHDMPLITYPSKFDAEHWESWLDRPEHNAILCGLTARQISNVASYPDWLILTATNQVVELEGLGELFGYCLPRIAALSDCSLESVWSCVLSVLKDGGLSDVHASQLRLNIKSTGRSCWHMLLWSIFYAIEKGYLTLGVEKKHQGIWEKKTGYVIDWDRLRETLEKTRLFVPDPIILEQAFPTTQAVIKVENGWMVSKALYEELRQEWLSTFSEIVRD